jgi:hypothetical protein
MLGFIYLFFSFDFCTGFDLKGHFAEKFYTLNLTDC